MVRVKVFCNGVKHGCFTFQKSCSLLKVIPQLEQNKLYSLKIFYKENDRYHHAEDPDEILITTDVSDNKTLLCYKNKYFSNQDKYLEKIYDISLLGRSKKKIVITESDKILYHIHISNVHTETLETKKIIDIQKNIHLTSFQEIEIRKEVNKVLDKYIYSIDKIHNDDECGEIRRIDVVVKIEEEKGFLKRWLEKIIP
jgi:hypothetical protein